MIDDFICALSGLAPTEEQEEHSTKDGLPEGWIEVTFKRHYVNPKWQAIQDLKFQLIGAALGQLKPEDREVAQTAVELQIEAQYLNLEDKTDQYIIEEEVAHISPPELDEEIMQEYDTLCELLGMDSLAYEDEDDGEEGGAIEESKEPDDTEEKEPVELKAEA